MLFFLLNQNERLLVMVIYAKIIEFKKNASLKIIAGTIFLSTRGNFLNFSYKSNKSLKAIIYLVNTDFL